LNGRTDLALEAAEELGEIPGIRREVFRRGTAAVTRILVETEEAAARLQKPRGRYVTVEVPPLTDDEKALGEQAAGVAEELAALLPETGPVLVAGLGNPAITPDAVGPQAADMVLATRHLQGEWARSMGLGDLRSVAVIRAGVLGRTGVESSELVGAVCRALRPAAVIAVDALAARSLARLGRTVQLCDGGIAPGSGVGNRRLPLDRASLGAPVIGMGVPTVVDAAAVLENFGASAPKEAETMMVTSREVDLMVRRAARLVALAINGALQPGYDPLDLASAAT